MAEMRRDIPTADEMDDFIELLTGDAYWNETHEDGSPSSLCRDAMRSALAIWLEEHPRESAGRAAWTKDIPTEPGYYWMREGDDCEIVYAGPEVGGKIEHVTFVGREQPAKMEAFDAEWLGPLRPLASDEENFHCNVPGCTKQFTHKHWDDEERARDGSSCLPAPAGRKRRAK